MDPEAIRVAKNGNSVFVADEDGPYVYRFEDSAGAVSIASATVSVPHD